MQIGVFRTSLRLNDPAYFGENLYLYIFVFLSYIWYHTFMTYLTCLGNIYGYFVAKTKMFSRDGGMN